MTHILKYKLFDVSNVGKSSILYIFLLDIYDIFLFLIVYVEFLVKIITYKNLKFKLNIWDISGNPNFRNITINYIRNANGIVFVFDKNNRKSFESLESWYKCIKENYNLDNKNKFQPTMLLVGSKYDQDK